MTDFWKEKNNKVGNVFAYIHERAYRGQGRPPIPLHRDKLEECR